MTEKTEQFVAFRVGSYFLAVPIARVKEVVRPLPITPLPSGPSFLEGIVELRGTVLPVLDLRKRLAQTPNGAPDKERFLIASIGGNIFALVADEVSDVLRIPTEEVKPAPLQNQASAIDRVFRHQDELYLVLQLDLLLSTEERNRLSELAQTLVDGASSRASGQGESQ